MSKEKKHISPLWQLVIGIILFSMLYIIDSPIGALISIFGIIFILSAIGNAILNYVKRRKEV